MDYVSKEPRCGLVRDMGPRVKDLASHIVRQNGALWVSTVQIHVDLEPRLCHPMQALHQSSPWRQSPVLHAVGRPLFRTYNKGEEE